LISKDVTNSSSSRISSTTCLYIAIVLEQCKEYRPCCLTLRSYESYDACCASRLGERKGECDEYSRATIHCKTSYMYTILIPIHAFPSQRRTTWVCRYCNLARVVMRTVLLVLPGTYMYSHLI
jgi:hypothetical protein